MPLAASLAADPARGEGGATRGKSHRGIRGLVSLVLTLVLLGRSSASGRKVSSAVAGASAGDVAGAGVGAVAGAGAGVVARIDAVGVLAESAFAPLSPELRVFMYSS